jgi:hypothetical protein
MNRQPFAALNSGRQFQASALRFSPGAAFTFVTFMTIMSALLASSPVSARQVSLSKDQVRLSTGYGQIVLDRVSLIQSDKGVSVSGTIDNATRQGWKEVVLTLTFYGKSGNVLPPEHDVSTLVRIQGLRRAEVRKFSGQIPWRIIHRKFRPSRGQITDFVVTYDSDASHPSVAGRKPAIR